jgi:hypothetical protein
MLIAQWLLIRLGLRPKMPVKGSRNGNSAIRHTCPLCSEPISYAGTMSKAQHFKDKHPEYHFIREQDPKGREIYTCVTCAKHFNTFRQLVAKHTHTEAEYRDAFKA